MISIASLARCRRGASAVEHALVLPAFFLLVLLVMETAWQVTVAIGVDHGARLGARWVSLGVAAPNGLSRSERLTEIVSSASGLSLNPALVSITATAYANFAQVNTPGAGTAGLGGPNDVVKYVVHYQSAVLTPMARLVLPSGWLIYRSVIITQNEPY